LTRIFLGPNSSASPRVIASTAPLLPEYTAASGTPALATELMLMTLPPFGPKYFTASLVARIVRAEPAEKYNLQDEPQDQRRPPPRPPISLAEGRNRPSRSCPP